MNSGSGGDGYLSAEEATTARKKIEEGESRTTRVSWPPYPSLSLHPLTISRERNDLLKSPPEC